MALARRHLVLRPERVVRRPDDARPEPDPGAIVMLMTRTRRRRGDAGIALAGPAGSRPVGSGEEERARGVPTETDPDRPKQAAGSTTITEGGWT